MAQHSAVSTQPVTMRTLAVNQLRNGAARLGRDALDAIRKGNSAEAEQLARRAAHCAMEAARIAVPGPSCL